MSQDKISAVSCPGTPNAACHAPKGKRSLSPHSMEMYTLDIDLYTCKHKHTYTHVYVFCSRQDITSLPLFVDSVYSPFENEIVMQIN